MKGREFVEADDGLEIRERLHRRALDIQPPLLGLENGVTKPFLRVVTENYGQVVHPEVSEGEILCNGEVLAISALPVEIDRRFPNAVRVRDIGEPVNPLLGLYDARIVSFDGEPFVPLQHACPLRQKHSKDH